MELWFYEDQAKGLRIGLRTLQTYYREKSKYQDICIMETEFYGRMLALDGIVQTTEKDEFTYHEMLVHVPLVAHPNPESVLVIGGGDGGSIREILKHPSVKKATLVEIDEKVTAASREYLPTLSSALSDPRVEMHFTDGIRFVAESRNAFDVIIVDSTDPIGAAVGLFKLDFYRSVYEALRPEGIFSAQTESPFIMPDVIRSVYADVSSVFPVCKLYLGTVPTYPGVLWSFTIGSKKHDPAVPDRSRAERVTGRYYNYDIHKSAFSLPTFVQELVRGGGS
ncbi:MAG: polyamine aminopropyltransferase [Bacillota bacterium]